MYYIIILILILNTGCSIKKEINKLEYENIEYKVNSKEIISQIVKAKVIEINNDKIYLSSRMCIFEGLISQNNIFKIECVDDKLYESSKLIAKIDNFNNLIIKKGLIINIIIQEGQFK